MNYLIELFCALCLLFIGALCFGFWSELGRLGRGFLRWLHSKRGDVLGVLFLAGVFGLAWGYAWLKWILTHEVR